MNAHASIPVAAPANKDVRLTPGAFMHACRTEAGVSIRRCAMLIARHDQRDIAMRDIRRLEDNQPGDYARLVIALRDSGAFPFNYATFIALAAETCDPDAPDFGA